ncbi:hypothetical protein C500_20915 [Natrialba magadii ATCC 43099]|nr:hypothetical protein C500_20915 [Natrialba magadii ATCC 43099]
MALESIGGRGAVEHAELQCGIDQDPTTESGA